MHLANSQLEQHAHLQRPTGTQVRPATVCRPPGLTPVAPLLRQDPLNSPLEPTCTCGYLLFNLCKIPKSFTTVLSEGEHSRACPCVCMVQTASLCRPALWLIKAGMSKPSFMSKEIDAGCPWWAMIESTPPTDVGQLAHKKSTENREGWEINGKNPNYHHRNGRPSQLEPGRGRVSAWVAPLQPEWRLVHLVSD